MNLTEIGRKLNEADILRIEAKIKLSFPKDYATFLFETNGGVPEDDIEFSFKVIGSNNGKEQILGSDIQYFYNDEESMETYENLSAENLIESTFFPIACDSFGNEILLCLNKTDDYGCVYFADHESETDDTLWFLYKIANTFSNFVSSLKLTEYSN